MNRPTRSRGFTAVEGLLIALALVLVAGAGYLVLKQNREDTKAPSASEQAETANTPAAPYVEESGDLDAASKTLDETNIDAGTTDTTDLDAQLSGF